MFRYFSSCKSVLLTLMRYNLTFIKTFGCYYDAKGQLFHSNSMSIVMQKLPFGNLSYFLSISAMDFPDDFSISLAAISVNFVANTFFFIALFTTHIILPMCKSRWYCDVAS